MRTIRAIAGAVIAVCALLIVAITTVAFGMSHGTKYVVRAPRVYVSTPTFAGTEPRGRATWAQATEQPKEVRYTAASVGSHVAAPTPSRPHRSTGGHGDIVRVVPF
jgi:hypothetical protein